MAPRTFPIRELRNHTSAVLDAARRDGEAFISNRGRVVARVTPLDGDGPSERDEFLDWIATWDPVDTGWADELAAAKQLDAQSVPSKPWE